MSIDIKHNVIINVNNHYEGPAPLTMKNMKALYKEKSMDI